MKKTKISLVVILAAIFLVVLIFFSWKMMSPSFQSSKKIAISSFSDCVSAGYPPLRSDDGQEKCLTADGQVFTKNLQGEEKSESLFSASGEFACLPPKDENQPHNDLCAFGLKSANGYYRLQSVSDDKFNVLAKLRVGDRVEVSGLFLKEESNYNSQGTIEVQSVRVLEASEAAKAAALPASFKAKFISFQDYRQTIIKAADYPKSEFWVENGEIQCQETPLESSLPLRLIKKEMGGHDYCIGISSEGAAGSVYSQYAYATLINDNVYLVQFVARFNNCANYPEAEMSRCQAERESFDINALVAQEIAKIK